MQLIDGLRSSGVLAHISSIPGPHGVGDLGPEAYRFVDFLVSSRQRLWQVLPLGPTGYGDSPYATLSAFAGNSLLISLESLEGSGLLSRDDLRSAPTLPIGPIDFEMVRGVKLPLLRRAFANLSRGPKSLQRALSDFWEANRAWIEDFVLFMALREAHGRVSWHDWQPELVVRDRDTLAKARTNLAGEAVFHGFLQFVFFQQWQALKSYANGRGLRIIGDLPLFVAGDSADVWSMPEIFKLDPARRPTVVAGVPPDYFSATGQRWGNPVYDWDALARTGYEWWISRVRFALGQVDVLRLDHFRGFVAYWEVPARERTAVNGDWVKGPGPALFSALRQALGKLPFIAEDLGVITADVDALREALGIPGMAVLQFAFDGGPTNAYLPHNLERNCVVYTGTHDNDTTRGWFESRGAAAAKKICRYVGGDGRDVAWDMIRVALNSVADTAIIPLQDVLDLGSEARMNTPGTLGGNWRWRYRPHEITEDLEARLAELTEQSGCGLRRGRGERFTYSSPEPVEE